MEGLGRLFNVVSAGDGQYIKMNQGETIAFLGYLASTGDTYTLVEAKDAAGTGAQNLVRIARYYTCTGNGSDAWVEQSQAAAATVVATSAAAQSALLFEVEGAWLSDGYKYIKCTSTGAATVTAILHDLYYQRRPANLVKIGV